MMWLCIYLTVGVVSTVYALDGSDTDLKDDIRDEGFWVVLVGLVLMVCLWPAFWLLWGPPGR